MAADATFADPAPVIQRDRWGRPLIVPPEGGQAVPYVRATTYAGTLDDTHGLTGWKCRMTALGLVDRQDLRIATAAHRDDKKELDAIVEQAQEAAGSSAAATMGTAVHKVTELIDLGKPTGTIPDEIVADVEAYQKATAKMKMLAVETFVVVDEHRVAGTFDRQVGFEGNPYIGDLKTSKSLDFGVGKFAIQLALYSRGKVFDYATGQRSPLTVDQDWGMIIHLPVGKGECTVYWIDLASGWEAVEYCAWVRKWRSRRDLLSPIDVERLAGKVIVSQSPPTRPAAELEVERIEVQAGDAPVRKQRACSKCRQPGHTAKNCPGVPEAVAEAAVTVVEFASITDLLNHGEACPGTHTAGWTTPAWSPRPDVTVCGTCGLPSVETLARLRGERAGAASLTAPPAPTADVAPVVETPVAGAVRMESTPEVPVAVPTPVTAVAAPGSVVEGSPPPSAPVAQAGSAPTQAPVANPAFRAPNRVSLEEWVSIAPSRTILVGLWNANSDQWDEALTRLAAARGNLLDAGMVGVVVG
jgi:Zinc knuckle